MTFFIRLIFCIFILLGWKTSFADVLDNQIHHFISEQLQDKKIDHIAIRYLAAQPDLNCRKPTLKLLSKNKLWGNLTLSAKCKNQTKYIQLYVDVVGSYIVANQAINADTKITEQHITEQSGQLDKLPATIILDKSQIINHIAIRHIDPQEPIKTSMLKRHWQVKAGQQVKVIINGDGYLVATKGKTLANGAQGDYIHVKLNTGTIVEGIVSEQGITINQ